MRSLKVYSIILATVLFAFFGVIYWPLAEKYAKEQKLSRMERDAEIADFQLADSYFKQNQYAAALNIISRRQNLIPVQPEMGKEWLSLLTRISEKTFDVPQLLLIYDYSKSSLDDYEKASLLVAESLIMNGQNEAYQELRQRWIGREVAQNKWALLDADYLLLAGRYNEGNKLLETELEGKDEIERLIRLSLLHLMENPEKALTYLGEAREKSPSDLDAFLYQTKVLEKLKMEEKVVEAFQKAIKDNPHSAFMHDQYAKFLVRQEKLQEALNIWKKALNIPSAKEEALQAEIWVSLNFFNQLIHGKKMQASPYAFLSSPLKPLVTYFSNLGPDVFFDEQSFSKLELKEEYLENEQTVYWLSLLDALSKNEKDQALELILNSPFKQTSFNPNLEFAFLQALNIQKTGEPLNVRLVNGLKASHPLLQSVLEEGSLGDSEKALLASEEAFAALSLAAGFTDTALKLHKLDVYPSFFPDWLKYGMVQAMRQKLGDEKALAFASQQLSEDTKFFLLMQEMNARVALNKGQKELAERIYESLSDSSLEAKSYLARKAFREQNFSTAEKLTEELLAKYPNNITLLDNLKKIKERRL